MITRPTPWEREYIKATGACPVWFCRPGDAPAVSLSRDPWRSALPVAAGAWFASDGGAIKCASHLQKQITSAWTAPDFLAAMRAYCVRNAVHRVDHASMLSMAAGTADEIEKLYAQKKAAGEFRAYFKARKRQRMEAGLLGRPFPSAYRDEFLLKVNLMKKAIEAGR